MELVPNEDVYQIYKGETDGSGRINDHILKLPRVRKTPPLYVSSNKKMPMIAQVFFGGVSLIGLYIIYRLLEKSKPDKNYLQIFS